MNLDLGLLLLRLVSGGTMLWQHGLKKMTNFSQYSTQFPDPFEVGQAASLGLVVFAEFFCAGLLILGLFSRLALMPLIITMAVAFFIIHGDDPFEKKELALLYLGIFSALFLTGSGRYSMQEFFKISAGRFSWFLK